MQCIWLCRTNTRSRLEHRREGGGGWGGGGMNSLIQPKGVWAAEQGMASRVLSSKQGM